MKHLPITLTLPEDVIKELHLYVPKGKISKFAAEALAKSLEIKKKQLERAYQEAANDSERNRELEEWDTLIGDGLDEKNAY